MNKANYEGQGQFAAVFSLFTSSGTLVCCALPALLVALGAGAALSSLVSAVPALVVLSEYKEAVFIFAGVMHVLSILNFVTRASKPALHRHGFTASAW
jgi:hypothetical protein